MNHQTDAFASDPYAAGTALYPDVGPPKPIDDLAGRIAQARTIAAYRGIPVAPFTVDEMAVLRRKLADGTPQERDALLAQLNALPDDMRAAIAAGGQTRGASLTQKPNAPVNVLPGMPRPTVPEPPKPEPPKPPKQQPPFHEQLPIIDPPSPPPQPHEVPAPWLGNEIV